MKKDEEPDCPCFEQSPSYDLCKKCTYTKTCVVPCLDKNAAVKAIERSLERDNEITALPVKSGQFVFDGLVSKDRKIINADEQRSAVIENNTVEDDEGEDLPLSLRNANRLFSK